MADRFERKVLRRMFWGIRVNENGESDIMRINAAVWRCRFLSFVRIS